MHRIFQLFMFHSTICNDLRNVSILPNFLFLFHTFKLLYFAPIPLQKHRLSILMRVEEMKLGIRADTKDFCSSNTTRKLLLKEIIDKI